MRTTFSRRCVLTALAGVLVTGLTLSFPSTASASCAIATAKATALGKQVTDIVANSSLSSGERIARFRSIFQKNANFPVMARFALGKYWKKLPTSQRKEYYKLVESLVVRVLFGQLQSFAGQKYSITTQRCLPKGTKGREFYVEGSVLNANGKVMTSVKWWFLKSGNSMKLFDFQVAGIWLTQQKRDEFVSFLNVRSGNISLLLADLRRRTGA